MQSCTELETCRFTLIRFLIFRFRPVPLVFIWSAMELISCVIHLFYLWRPVFVTQLLPLNLPPPPPLFLLLLTCLCAGLLLSPLGDSRLQLVCACVCVRVCMCARDCQRGWGQSTQPLQSPSNRAVWCGTGGGAGDGGWLYSDWGEQSPMGLQRWREGGKAKKEGESFAVLLPIRDADMSPLRFRAACC